MTYKIRYTKTFQKELEQIHNYIETKLFAKKSADRIVNKVKEEVENLRTSAQSYYLLSKSKNGNIEKHRLIVKNYIVIYQINLMKKEIQILHIFYSRKNYLNNF